MNKNTVAIDNKVSNEDIQKATAKWNTMDMDARWPYIASVPKSMMRNQSASFVFITAGMKRDGLI